MKSAIFWVMALLIMSLTVDGNAQSKAEVKEAIENSSENFVRWFNNGHVDSLMTSYSEDACLLTLGCGKEYIRGYFESQVKIYKFKELRIISVNVSKTIAVEKGHWVVELQNGQEFEGEYLTEWKRFGKKWLIVNDISNMVR